MPLDFICWILPHWLVVLIKKHGNDDDNDDINDNEQEENKKTNMTGGHIHVTHDTQSKIIVVLTIKNKTK